MTDVHDRRLGRGAGATHMLRIGLVGTRGVPAAYGGFETAIEEIGSRLAARGHEVLVHCRSGNAAKLSGEPGAPDPAVHKGMRLVHLPAARRKAVETLSHTACSGLRHQVRRDTDVNFVFNAANAPLLPLLRAGGVPTVVHVDGLEWKRGKWGPTGRAYYRLAESLAVRWADALIADAAGIQDYYRHQFGVETTMIPYGAPVLGNIGSDRLAELGLGRRGYHLVVARMEPENHVDLIVEGYHRSRAERPLVVVGTAPYAAGYIDRIRRTAQADARIRLVGGVWDQNLLDQLYGNALSYVHGHSVGGTNPSLLRAMGAGAPVLAYDVVFNREVLGEDGRFFGTPSGLAASIEELEREPDAHVRRGARLAERAERHYDWDRVTDDYEVLARRVVGGASTRGAASGRRLHRRDPWEGDRVRSGTVRHAAPGTTVVAERAVEGDRVRLP